MTQSKIFSIGFFTPFVLFGSFLLYGYFTQFINGGPTCQSQQETLIQIKPLQQSIEQNITFSADGASTLANYQDHAPQNLPDINLLKIYPNGDIILATKTDALMRLSPQQAQQKDGTIQWTCLASVP